MKVILSEKLLSRAWQLFCLLNLTTITVWESDLSAQAKPIPLDRTKQTVDLSVVSSTQLIRLLLVEGSHPKLEAVSATSTPFPGTAATSAAALAPYLVEPASATAALRVEQADGNTNSNPGVDTNPAPTETAPKSRPFRNYIGIGGSIGLQNRKTALGGGGFAILGRIGLAKLGNSVNLSLHNATVVFGNRTATSMFAFTVETPLKNKSSGQVVVSPFLGGGVLLRNTGGSEKVAPLLSGGVDVPLSRKFTVTARVNAGFLSGDTEVGLLLGVGYNYSLFGRR